MAMNRKIRSKERDSIIQSLRAGVTPKVGLQHIQVGRANEVKALFDDIERISDGGSGFRLIIGDYGSGKTFFLSLIRTIAMERKLVTANADLSPDRRLHASKGQARNLYSELMRNISTRTKPEGGALNSIVEKFISEARREADSAGVDVSSTIHTRLSRLTEMVGGYYFANGIDAYWRGYDQDNDELKSNAVRWLRAEFGTKTEARKALGVRSIIDDHSFYDHLKLMSLLVRQAGYSGLLINLDEMVNLYKLSSTQARTSNYEQILRILNDCLQGSADSLGFVMGGTPEFLLDPRKGLYSYEALQSRLAENSFAKQAGVIDYSSPALHLSSLTPEELFILLRNLRNVFAGGDESKYLLDDQGLKVFLTHCSQTIGDSYFKTPRNTIKAFINLMSVLEQNPSLEWRALIGDVTIEADRPDELNAEIQGEPPSNDLAEFRL